MIRFAKISSVNVNVKMHSGFCVVIQNELLVSFKHCEKRKIPKKETFETILLTN